MAVNWYCNFGDGATTGYYAVAKWAANTAYTVGQIRRQNTTPSVGSERCFVCGVAGTSSNPTEPTWTLSKNGKTTDNTVSWYECTGTPSLNGDVTNTPASSTFRNGLPQVGQIIKNNAADHFFICTTSSFAGSGEPSYNTTTGATTTDGSAVWTCLGAVSSFTTAWAAPFCRLVSALAFGWPNSAGGDTVFVSAAHQETTSASYSISFPGGPAFTYVLCVANAPSAIPPVVADLTTGATVSTTGLVAPMTLQNSGYVEGIAFSVGTSTSGQSLTVGSNGGLQVYQNCSLALGGTSSGKINLGANGGKLVLNNTPMIFGGGVGQGIFASFTQMVWRDTPSALTKNGTSWPITLFGFGTSGDLLVENVDLSAFAGTDFVAAPSTGGRLVISHCKLPSISPLAVSIGAYGTTMDLINCDSGGATYRHERWSYEGSQIVDTSAVRTGGAGDGTTAYSWKIATTANSQWPLPFEALPISIWNTLTGANRTVTIEGAYNGAALPNNDDIWLEVVYLGTAASTQGTRVTQTKATLLSANAALGSSAALWGGSAPARQNTHAYSVGDLIGVSSASSIVRLFVCTGAGTSNGSLPGGYASAVDGGVVTDSGATFRAVERFQLTVTLNSPQPQAAGHFVCYVRAAKVSSTFWVDPYVTLS